MEKYRFSFCKVVPKNEFKLDEDRANENIREFNNLNNISNLLESVIEFCEQHEAKQAFVRSEEDARVKEVVLAAVSNNGWALKYADKDLQKDKEVVLAAVSNNGWALQFADEELQKDKEVVLAAVSNYGRAIEFADKKFIDDMDVDVILAAVSYTGCAFIYADAPAENPTTYANYEYIPPHGFFALGMRGMKGTKDVNVAATSNHGLRTLRRYLVSVAYTYFKKIPGKIWYTPEVCLAALNYYKHRASFRDLNDDIYDQLYKDPFVKFQAVIRVCCDENENPTEDRDLKLHEGKKAANYIMGTLKNSTGASLDSKYHDDKGELQDVSGWLLAETLYLGSVPLVEATLEICTLLEVPADKCHNMAGSRSVFHFLDVKMPTDRAKEEVVSHDAEQIERLVMLAYPEDVINE